MAIGRRIKEARLQKSLTQEQLAKIVGVTKGAIANYENNTSHPKEHIIYDLMKALDVDANFLFQDFVISKVDYATPYEMEHLIKKYRAIDEHGKEIVDAVLDIEHQRCLKEIRDAKVRRNTEESTEIGAESVRYVVQQYTSPMSAGTGQLAGQEAPENIYLTKAPPRGTSYIAPVSGDSMAPTYENGDLLFIHATPEIGMGQIGVFLMDGQQWVKELGNGVLISHNKGYSPIPMTEDIQCQGLVLGVCDESYFE